MSKTFSHIKTLYEDDNHSFTMISIEQEENGESFIQTNQYLVRHNNEAILLDPGGEINFDDIYKAVDKLIDIKELKYIFLSHQDPDVTASLLSWRNATGAKIILPKWWIRFVSLFGISDLSAFVGIEDYGANITLGADSISQILPSHFLHSPANLCLYDPVSKILFSGDIGSAIFPFGVAYNEVYDFDLHKKYIEQFHRRYMHSNLVCLKWVESIAHLEIDKIAPQHGAVYAKDSAQEFLHWFSKLKCGADLIDELYMKPKQEF